MSVRRMTALYGLSPWLRLLREGTEVCDFIGLSIGLSIPAGGSANQPSETVATDWQKRQMESWVAFVEHKARESQKPAPLRPPLDPRRELEHKSLSALTAPLICPAPPSINDETTWFPPGGDCGSRDPCDSGQGTHGAA
jgi:hypothetical protein